MLHLTDSACVPCLFLVWFLLREVLQLHLALTSEVNSMRVSWVTGHASQGPAVRFREAVFADSQPGETQPARWQVGGPQHQRKLIFLATMLLTLALLQQNPALIPSSLPPKRGFSCKILVLL